jgi:pyrroloquinoline quinone biosynthesis protein B
MKRILIALIVFWFVAPIDAATRPYVIVLGIGQDAGVPQLGCRAAWKSPALRQMVSSIALVDPDSGKRWIFDATPDLPEQFELLREITKDRSTTIDGILLTHAHIGHYTGLMYLGRESLNSKSVPVYAMPRMAEMLSTNAPWSQLVELKNIELRPLVDKKEVRLTDELSVMPFMVPHRDEFSETVGYRINSGSRSLIFIPDIDKWDKWETKLSEVLATTNYALLDGTFYADGEIARPKNEVPHPFVSETMELLRDLPVKERNKVFFIHFNHSNPLVQGKVKERSAVGKAGFHVARTGIKLTL